MAAKRTKRPAEGSLSAGALRALAKGGSLLRPVKVDVPAWGGHVYVRPLSGTERDEFELAYLLAKKVRGEDRAAIGIRARTVCAHLCDEKGARLFSPIDDAEAIGCLDAPTLDHLFDVCRNLSGISAADVEELEGN